MNARGHRAITLNSLFFFCELQDVNSFVAKADSAKHSCPLVSDDLLLDDFTLKRSHRDFLSSSSESTNEDSEDDYSDNNNETDLRWPHLTDGTIYSTPTINKTANNNTHKPNAREKLMIKIKKTSHNKNLSHAPPSPYGEHNWDMGTLKSSKSLNCRNTKQQRKSMPNIYGMTTQPHHHHHQQQQQQQPYSKKKMSGTNKARRGSAPLRRPTMRSSKSNASLNSIHSSSSLSSLSNNLQRSMRVSESMQSFLSSDAEEELQEEGDVEPLEEEDEDDDEDYQHVRSTATTTGQLSGTTKKGRNVDKACNHCKRSHLRCDDMRPCRRCVATGKSGCKDVQHKPRGRPKLHKK